ncbi:cupin domain-containing protein [Phenylobacterium sp. LjRoot225]|uniref:(R)-mandelonitrile lyase n=1 Tax=Phenylobacterium sp. LjRoot225 TaxID=3342285 RepID=UPI003ECFFBDD
MRSIAFGLLAVALAAPAHAAEPPQIGKLEIQRNGSPPSAKGPAANFTGAVRLDTPFAGRAPSRVSGSIVTFEPGARTAWHTHPLGQTLIVTSGCGWVQAEGGRKAQIRPGDVVWTPPGVRHWHGAAATTPITHVAIVEAVDGSRATWMEQVSAEQYGAPAGEAGC